MKIRLNDKVYDILKWVVMIVLPAIGVLYSSLSGLWGWPYTEQIVGTLSAVELFLGALIGVSTRAYNAEMMEILLNDFIDENEDDVEEVEVTE